MLDSFYKEFFRDGADWLRFLFGVPYLVLVAGVEVSIPSSGSSYSHFLNFKTDLGFSTSITSISSISLSFLLGDGEISSCCLVALGSSDGPVFCRFLMRAELSRFFPLAFLTYRAVPFLMDYDFALFCLFLASSATNLLLLDRVRTGLGSCSFF